ncbi:MAG: Glu/Leu/Phe/Val dehydrogenase dimerization domain-containing protein [Pseudomonadota bacterium]
MQIFSHPDFDGHEQVVFARDPAAGLSAIIAVHNTALGPGLGGCRIWRYDSEADAVTDAMRLSRGMTYKAALAGLPLGGGKSVILADSRTEKTPEMMRAMGRAVERLGGRYIVAEDVGATVADMDEIATETAHVSGVSDGAGDPSPWTAEGVFLSMQAAAQHRWGSDVAGRRISVQGLGNVGAHLCKRLARAGARLIASDIRRDAVERIVEETGAETCDAGAAHAVEADIFAPCALGAGLNAETIPDVKAEIICGAANNQLATEADGDRLDARGILYAPDYLINAGGLISVARRPIGMDEPTARAKLADIPATLNKIFDSAAQHAIAPHMAADRLAESLFRPPSSAHA